LARLEVTSQNYRGDPGQQQPALSVILADPGDVVRSRHQPTLAGAQCTAL